MSDPQIERALEEFFESERLSRRGFIGRAGSTGLALSGLSAVLAACGGVKGEADNAPSSKPQIASANHPHTPIGNMTFSNRAPRIHKNDLHTVHPPNRSPVH